MVWRGLSWKTGLHIGSLPWIFPATHIHTHKFTITGGHRKHMPDSHKNMLFSVWHKAKHMLWRALFEGGRCMNEGLPWKNSYVTQQVHTQRQVFLRACGLLGVKHMSFPVLESMHACPKASSVFDIGSACFSTIPRWIHVSGRILLLIQLRNGTLRMINEPGHHWEHCSCLRQQRVLEIGSQCVGETGRGKRKAANWDIEFLCGPRRTTKHSDHRLGSKWDRKKPRTDVGQTNTSTGRPNDRVMGPEEGFSTFYLFCSCSSGASWFVLLAPAQVSMYHRRALQATRLWEGRPFQHGVTAVF